MVVDGAHAFKHENRTRATALRTRLSRGAARKVLPISATPVATSIADLLGEFAVGEAAAGAGRFEQRVGHDWRGRIRATARTIERAARTGPVSRDAVVQAGLDNDLLGITGPIVIRRTRGMIRNRPDAGAGPVFPTAENLRETFKYLDKAERITYEGAAAAVAALTFGHYDMLAAAAAPGRTIPGSAAGLRRTGLLKQLETCVKTTHDGLCRNLDELRAWLDWATNGPQTGVPAGTAGTEDDDEIDDGTDWMDQVDGPGGRSSYGTGCGSPRPRR